MRISAKKRVVVRKENSAAEFNYSSLAKMGSKKGEENLYITAASSSSSPRELLVSHAALTARLRVENKKIRPLRTSAADNFLCFHPQRRRRRRGQTFYIFWSRRRRCYFFARNYTQLRDGITLEHELITSFTRRKRIQSRIT